MKKRLISIFVVFLLILSIFALAEDTALVCKAGGIRVEETENKEVFSND